MQAKRKQTRPGFELQSPYPFPRAINFTPNIQWDPNSPHGGAGSTRRAYSPLVHRWMPELRMMIKQAQLCCCETINHLFYFRSVTEWRLNVLASPICNITLAKESLIYSSFFCAFLLNKRNCNWFCSLPSEAIQRYYIGKNLARLAVFSCNNNEKRENEWETEEKLKREKYPWRFVSGKKKSNRLKEEKKYSSIPFLFFF